MALQLWMPLMGDLRNQGLSTFGITTLGTISWVTGKLGAKALKAGTEAQTVNGLQLNSNLCDLLNGNYSVSVWLKPYGTHVHYNGSVMSSGNWNTANKRWAFGVSQDNTKVDVLCMNYNTYIDCPVPVNEWTHIVCARGDDDIVKLYKNGEYIGQRNCSSDPTFDSDANVTCIGRESYANGYFSFNGAIQDLRLYDHCLSIMEVKELSKGLVLHYPLNRGGWGQENLATCTTPQYNLSASTGNYNYFWIASKDTLTIGETYTVSAEVTVSDNIERCTIYNYHTNPTTSGPQYNYFPADGKRHSWTFTATATGLLGYCGVAGATANHTAIYKNIKIEKGSIATSYIPRSNETLYTTMGLNGTTEYDCSGYCNNGSKMTDTITYTSDTAKYQVSTHFNGTYDGILVEDLQLSDIINSAITYAFWIKPDGESGARSVYFGSYSGNSWSIEKTTGNVLRLYWNGSPNETCSGATITDGVWQHVCITKSGTSDVKVYINGIQKWSSTKAHNNLSFPTTYRLGRDVRSNDGTPYKGLMSDFRIYATALSADDVKSLYQNSTYIDSSGNVYGAVHSEV